MVAGDIRDAVRALGEASIEALIRPEKAYRAEQELRALRYQSTTAEHFETRSTKHLVSAHRQEMKLPVIATAAWSIPKAVADRFPEEGTGLSRYASVFSGVEINSTFYRQHRASTFVRWADSVPDDFRFAVKMPKDLTHARRLRDIGVGFKGFLEEIAHLGRKVGPLLCQLPPNLAFHPDEAEAAFETMRNAYAGSIVIEVRHKSWASEPAMSLLDGYSIDRVLADPAPVWQIADFPHPPRYMRLHGKPKLYYSNYTEKEIRSFSKLLAADSWCVFDNTASGAACGNALTMLDEFCEQ